MIPFVLIYVSACAPPFCQPARRSDGGFCCLGDRRRQKAATSQPFDRWTWWGFRPPASSRPRAVGRDLLL